MDNNLLPVAWHMSIKENLDMTNHQADMFISDMCEIYSIVRYKRRSGDPVKYLKQFLVTFDSDLSKSDIEVGYKILNRYSKINDF